MSTHFMSYVLRLCDRLFDKDSPDAIDRQGQLNQMVALVVIFHLIMGTSFLKMQDYEKKHPRIIRDVNISFEFTAPPPAADFKVGQTDLVPQPINLTPGPNRDVGSADREKGSVEKLSIPTPKAEVKEQPLTPKPVETQQSKSIVDAPVSVINNSQIKPDPTQLARSNAYTNSETNLAGNTSITPESGAERLGGDTSSKNGAGGKGGNGPGGEGVDQGLPGTGSGNENVGSLQLPKMAINRSELARGGNIRPYKNAIAKLLQESWHPGRKGLTLTVNILISKDGELLSTEIVASSGIRRIDREAIEMISGLDFEPLPDWFMGQDLLFQFEMNSN